MRITRRRVTTPTRNHHVPTPIRLPNATVLLLLPVPAKAMHHRAVHHQDPVAAILLQGAHHLVQAAVLHQDQAAVLQVQAAVHHQADAGNRKLSSTNFYTSRKP